MNGVAVGAGSRAQTADVEEGIAAMEITHNGDLATTTATGARVEITTRVDPAHGVNQAVMESRKDFHTHPRSLALGNMQLGNWRPQERLRTVSALLVTCLNLGTDPPDLVKPAKSSVLEAWVDPNAPVQAPTSEEMALQIANGTAGQRNPARERTPMKQIMENLQRQFETIQRHARYKALPDCAIEDLKKYCVQFRRGSKDGRIMFYYNGHGVPRPTGSGDIWVFNRQFTQYIPVSAADLMAWVGTPGAYIWDCSHAMSVVAAFQKGARVREGEIKRIRRMAQDVGFVLPEGRMSAEELAAQTTAVAAAIASQLGPGGRQAGQHPQQQAAPVNPALISLALLPQIYRDDIHFAATRSNELLPTNPVLPADLFTSCLTTPVRVAMRFWVTCNPQAKNITVEMCEQLPGSVQDRRTPLGELNWILTSITDTIAWTTVPRELFSRLFRQDMMLSTLFRNYILADHIMRYYGVHPYCSPELPPTHKHPLWASLDLEIDMCLQQLPRLIKEEKRRKRREEKLQQKAKEREARNARAAAAAAAASRRGVQGQHHGRAGPRVAAAAPAAMPTLQQPKLDIAGGFRSMTWRHGSRIGTGGTIDSGDEGSSSESSSDNDDDDDEEGHLYDGSEGTGYISSSYFSNQLHAFEVWLQHAATVVSQFLGDQDPDSIPKSLTMQPPPGLEAPDELPAVLQVLLSQQYRLRSLILLYRFMNLGPWAVNLSMAVGIFPYISKLLASTTTEIREILILVWARLSAVDHALHPELLKNNSFTYFVSYLANNIQMQCAPVSDKVRLCDTVSAASAFTLTVLCRDHEESQKACFHERLLDFYL
ncbi:Target of rapamycin complex 1 subunit kog1, partial [Linderina pennispora]